MRKFFILSLFLTVLSCGKSDEEQMLYNYQAEKAKELWNMNIDNLEFEIHNIEKVGSITASDSILYYKTKLAEIWDENPSQKLIDSITYDFVLKSINQLIENKQDQILYNIELGKSYKNYDLKSKRDQYIDVKADVVTYRLFHESYSDKKDSILSHKYKASYSLKNPSLNNNIQTFERFFYSDSKNEKLIAMKNIE